MIRYELGDVIPPLAPLDESRQAPLDEPLLKAEDDWTLVVAGECADAQRQPSLSTESNSSHVGATSNYADLARAVGRRIASLRRQQKMSAQELASQLMARGVVLRRDSIASLETGRRAKLTVAELLAVADTLGVPPSALTDGRPVTGDATKHCPTCSCATKELRRLRARRARAQKLLNDVENQISSIEGQLR